jgi:hypothetical protein
MLDRTHGQRRTINLAGRVSTTFRIGASDGGQRLDPDVDRARRLGSRLVLLREALAGARSRWGDASASAGPRASATGH